MTTTHAMRCFTAVGPTRRVPMLRDGERAYWAGCSCGWEQTQGVLMGDDLDLLRSNLVSQWQGHVDEQRSTDAQMIAALHAAVAAGELQIFDPDTTNNSDLHQ